MHWRDTSPSRRVLNWPSLSAQQNRWISLAGSISRQLCLCVDDESHHAYSFMRLSVLMGSKQCAAVKMTSTDRMTPDDRFRSQFQCLRSTPSMIKEYPYHRGEVSGSGFGCTQPQSRPERTSFCSGLSQKSVAKRKRYSFVFVDIWKILSMALILNNKWIYGAISLSHLIFHDIRICFPFLYRIVEQGGPGPRGCFCHCWRFCRFRIHGWIDVDLMSVWQQMTSRCNVESFQSRWSSQENAFRILIYVLNVFIFWCNSFKIPKRSLLIVTIIWTDKIFTPKARAYVLYAYVPILITFKLRPWYYLL